MVAPTSAGEGLVTSRSYFSLLRRLNLLRQVMGFRTERDWNSPEFPLERTRQFFVARGTVPYHFQEPVVLTNTASNPFSAVNVFFGPAHSDQIVIFGRRQKHHYRTLIHVNGSHTVEHDHFPLDKRFGVARQVRITSLFGWRMRWGTFDEYVNPVEFIANDQGEVSEIRVRVNANLEEGPSQELPALLIGRPHDDTYRWTITRLGQAHDWFPDANVKLFLPGYDPQEVVYGLTNERFICKGTKKGTKEAGRWGVWNDCWDQAGHRPLVADLDTKQIGSMAVNTIDNGKTVYSCVLGSLPPSHPLSADCPGILLTSEQGQLGMVPLENLVDINHVVSVHVAGSMSGIFHCMRRGPTAQLVIHQNGIPLSRSLDNLEFHGFHVEEEHGAQPLIRVKLVASENNGQRLVLYTATSTAWTDTLAMMNTPVRDLEHQRIEQEHALEQFIADRQGSSVTALQVQESKKHMDRSALVKWWNYLAAQMRQRLGIEPGPYVTRLLAVQLLESYRTESGEYRLEPLLVPLAKLFGIEVKAVGDLEADPDFVRYSEELRKFLLENRLIIGSNDLAPSGSPGSGQNRNGGEVMLILHPSALEWKEQPPEPENPSPGEKHDNRIFPN